MGTILWIIGGVVLFLTFAVLLTAYICFYRVFYSPKRKLPGPDEYDIPDGEIYEAFREDMINWTKMIRSMPHEDLEIKSYDGLTLRGKYYEHHKGAIIEILFHGYGGYSERDLSGGVERCFALGRSAILVDQRGAGHSDGHVVTFGVNERRDCVAWAKFVAEKFGPDTKIVITGVSMGAATVMTVASMELPPNVVGVLADCGYTSTKEIVKKVIRDMKLPANLLYPFARLSARVFGGFDPEESSAIESMKKCKLPIIFFHGDADTFVPCEMSIENHAACTSEKKRLVITEGAGHGLCYPKAPEEYVSEMRSFFGEIIEK